MRAALLLLNAFLVVRLFGHTRERRQATSCRAAERAVFICGLEWMVPGTYSRRGNI